MLLVLLCGFGLSLASLLMLGKQQLYLGDLLLAQSAQHLQRGLHPLTPKEHVAGTQAVLYPSDVLPEFIAYVADRFGILSGDEQQQHAHAPTPLPGPFRLSAGVPPIDVLLNEFSRSRAYLQLHLSPDVVQHMGAFSSAPNKNKGNFGTLKTSPSFRP